MQYTYEKLKAFLQSDLYHMALLAGRPALDNPDAVEFLIMCAAHESKAGLWREQLGGGPARGLYQIEPETHDSIWDTSDIIQSCAKRCGFKRNVDLLVDGDSYSTFMARMYLAQDTDPLPSRHDVFKMADYAKTYWNRTGKAEPLDYQNAYELFKEGEL